MKPSAKIIADSISEAGIRLTTMEVTMHRFILAEMNTHRAFSRNSASSRAIPSHKIQERVQKDLAWPVLWGQEQKGMQTGQRFGGTDELLIAQEWELARDYALGVAERLTQVGLHKSLVNRLLEPFMWHTAIITATDWDNFFWQRCHPDAQPEMKAVADEMQRAYYTHEPKALAHGQWHLPYIDEDNDEWCPFDAPPPFHSYMEQLEAMKKISVARCARVSYLTQDGIRDLSKDLELFDRLKGSGHWSPFEHVATPTNSIPTGSNFRGWKQFRKEFRDENRTNFVPNLPDLSEARARVNNRMETSVSKVSPEHAPGKRLDPITLRNTQGESKRYEEGIDHRDVREIKHD